MEMELAIDNYMLLFSLHFIFFTQKTAFFNLLKI